MEMHVFSNKKGFTIIETLIAMFIFSLVLIFMAQGFLLAYKLNLHKLARDEAVKIAQEELERLRNTSFDSISSVCSGACNNPLNITQSNCKITRQIRNSNVTFGREIQVTTNGSFKTVTIKICAPYKDHTGNFITYEVATVISEKGF